MATRRKSILDGILYFFNWLAAVLLLGAYLAYYIPPSFFVWFQFLALGYSILLLVNFLFGIYWLIRLKTKIFLSIICIGIGFFHIGRLYQFGSPEVAVNAGETLKIMTMNVRMFNAQNWIEGLDAKVEIGQLIAEEDPDILLLQEFHQKKIEPELTFGYPHRHTKEMPRGRFRSVIFSKFPIIGSQTVMLDGDSIRNNAFHFADVNWKGKTFRVMNVHLASVHFDHGDYEALKNPTDQNTEQLERNARDIARQLREGFIRREVQVKILQEQIAFSPHPVLLAGDFNDVPFGYVYHQIDLKLDDAFAEGGEGFGKTYNKSPVPLRIDYIFHSEGLRVFNYKTLNDRKLSDHFGVVVEVR